MDNGSEFLDIDTLEQSRLHLRHDIGNLKQADIKRIERWINDYPRRMFGYKSVNQLLAA